MPQVEWLNEPRAGWSKLPNWAVEFLEDLPPSAAMLYLRLVRMNRVQEDGSLGVWASTATLAEWMGKDQRYVRRLVDRLVDAGLIVVTKPGVRGRATVYFIVQKKPRNKGVHQTPAIGQATPKYGGPPDPPTKTARSARSRVKFTGTSG